MAQVILIEDNLVLNELISINLISFLGIDLIKRKNADAVLNLLDILPEVDLIICHYEIDGENTAAIIQQYILHKQLEIGMIVLGGSSQLDNDFTVTILNPKDWEKVVEYSAKILGITDELIAKRVTPDYVPIPLDYFFNLVTVNCDVFIRIKKTPTEYQFVKRIHNGDNFTREAITRYRDQGLDSFYIPKDQQKTFTTFLSNILVGKLESPTLELHPRLELMGESYTIAAREILKLGFTSEIVQLTDAIIHNMIKNVEESPEMSSLLHKVINAQTPLMFQRCHMTSVIASECLKNLKLDTPESIMEMTFASFFHDIMLVDHPELAKINSANEMALAHLSNQDSELVLNHALEASRLIGRYPNIPAGVEKIIKEHHGIGHGLGFSYYIEDFSTLSKVFIIAHEFVVELIKYKDNKSSKESQKRPLSEELYQRFPGTSCTKIIKALEQSLIKKKTSKTI
jgi:hypothetical protein